MKPFSPLALLLLSLAATPSFAATHYISPSGSDSAGGTATSPFKTLSHAFSVGAGGDTYILKDGVYNYSGSEINGNAKSGTAGAYTTIKAENDGGAVISVSGGLAMRDSSTPLQQYIQVEGLRFDGSYEKHIYGSNIKFLRCGFKGGPSSGNTMNTLIGGNNNGSNLARYVLLEDCWFYGGGGRYKLLVFNAENIVLRRIVVRNDAGWNDSPNTGNPEACIAIYNSSSCEAQDILLVDNDQSYYEYGQAFYLIHNQSAMPDHVVTGNRIRGLIVLNTKAVGFRSDATTSSDNQMEDAIVVNSQDWAYSWGANDNTAFTLNRVAAIRKNSPFSPASSSGGFGYWGTGGGIGATNIITANYTSGNDFDGVNPSYFDTYNNGGTKSGTGQKTYNPETNGLLYPPRIETGSALKTAGSGGGQIGPQIANKIGASGSLWGDSGYNSDTGQALWPWPNEARIKSDLCSGVSRGFCGSSSLTNYIWSYFGHATPSDIGGSGGGDTTAPNVSLTAPANNATISGSAVSVSASASDNVGVVGVMFKVDNVNMGAEDTSVPFSDSLNTTVLSNGSHVISAVARDAAGNTQTASVTVNVSNAVADTTPPNISLSAPANNATVSGGAVTILASATDNVGVAGVQIKIDGVNSGAEDTSAPYGKYWDSTAVANGSHVITVVARDAAGNTDTASVTVNVSNAITDTTPPTAPASVNLTAESSTTCRLAWAPASDNKAVAGYLLVLAYDAQFQNRVPGFNGVNVGNVTSAMLTGLSPATVYYARIYAFDSAPNVSGPSIAASAATGLPPAPAVTQTNAVALSANSVKVTWQTSSASRCLLQYGLTTTYGQTTSLEPSYSASHTVTLSDLAYKMLYHVRIIALDTLGQTTVSSDMTFQTPLRAQDPSQLVSSHFITPDSPGSDNASAVFDPDVKHVSIFDMRGRQVFDADGTGAQSIVWTARDDSGRTLESGAYLARLTDSANQIRSQVIVIAK